MVLNWAYKTWCFEHGKNPKAFFLVATEGKFHNSYALFSLPSGHENIIGKIQKSAVYSLYGTRFSIIFYFLWVQIPSFRLHQWEKVDSNLISNGILIYCGKCSQVVDYSQILVSLKSVRFLLLISCELVKTQNMLDIWHNRNFKGPLTWSKQSLASSWTTDPAGHILSYN